RLRRARERSARRRSGSDHEHQGEPHRGRRKNSLPDRAHVAARSHDDVHRYRFAEFTLSPRRRTLVRGGRELPLIPRYFDLLVFLLERRHDAVHRREIFDRVWSEVVVSDSALSQAVRTLRRTLDDDSREPRFIRTVSRHGYQFVYPDVAVDEDDGGPPRAARPAADSRRDAPEDAGDPFEPLLMRIARAPATAADEEDARE